MPETAIEPVVELIPVEAPPEQPNRDEIYRQLLPELSEEAQRDIWQECNADILAAFEDRLEWENRLADWDDMYYGNLPEKKFPWPGASNLHVPLTLVGMETLKPRLVEVVMGWDPPVFVIPTRYTEAERKERVESFLNWQLMTELDLERKVPESAHLFLNPGTVVAKVFWKVERKRTRYIRSYPPTTSLEEILSAALGDKIIVDSRSTEGSRTIVDGTYTASAMGGGDLDFHIELTATELEQLILVDTTEIVEKPFLDLLDPLDFITPAKGGSDVQKLPWCAHRMWLSPHDLREKVLLHQFRADAVEALLRETETVGDEEGQQGQAARETRDEAEGVPGQGASDVRATQYAVYEVFRAYDLDDDGLNEEVIFYFSPDLPDMLLGYDFLTNVHAHGMRPLAVGRYHPIPFRFLGMSFPQLVEQLQREINTIHNQRVDYATLQNLPMYFFRGSSAHSPLLHRLRPGVGVPIDNPQADIMFPKWQGNQAWASQEESLIYQYFERATGVTDLALGRQPNRVGATRTASGVASLLSEAGLRFKTSMTAFQRFWKDVFQLVLALDQQYLPPGKEFRVTGKLPEYVRMESRKDIAGKFDLRLSPATENLNKAVMREDATVIWQTLMNPMLLQMGMVGMKAMSRGLRDFLQAYGKDPEQYLEAATSQIVHTPEEELGLFLMGHEEHMPSPAENLQEHLKAHAVQLRDPTVQAQLGAKGMTGLQKHLIATQQMYQANLAAQQMAMKGGGEGAGPGTPSKQPMNAQTGRNAPDRPGSQAGAGKGQGNVGERGAGGGAGPAGA